LRRTDEYVLEVLDDQKKSAHGQRKIRVRQRSGQGSHNMTAKSIARIVLPSLALVAACGAALVFGLPDAWQERPVESQVATAVPAASLPAADARDEAAVALATAETEANTLTAGLAESPRSPHADEFAPVIDVARIEQTGEAVIAGRAAPGAVVELLVNGQSHHQEVADQSGQFVMVPARLPRGDYELTLRSRQQDGKQATSKQGVAVALHDTEPRFGAVASATEQDTVVATGSVSNQATGASQAAAVPPANEGSPSAGAVPKTATKVVSRGDSLWRISRVAYGDGKRYAVLYKANRGHIRDPNRIFPGQIVVLPTKAR
jgi:nucleoid-associated protein YgaU